MSFELFFKNLTDFRKTVQTAGLDLRLKLFTSLSTVEKTCRGILTAVFHTTFPTTMVPVLIQEID